MKFMCVDCVEFVWRKFIVVHYCFKKGRELRLVGFKSLLLACKRNLVFV